MMMHAVYHWDQDSFKFKNNPLLPNSFRMLIVGPSNSGKTHLLLKLILEEYFDFERLIICSKSLFQTEYKILVKGLESHLHLSQIKEFFNQQKEIREYEKAIVLLAENNKKRIK